MYEREDLYKRDGAYFELSSMPMSLKDTILM